MNDDLRIGRFIPWTFLIRWSCSRALIAAVGHESSTFVIEANRTLQHFDGTAGQEAFVRQRKGRSVNEGDGLD